MAEAAKMPNTLRPYVFQKHHRGFEAENAPVLRPQVVVGLAIRHRRLNR
jgi:hypothetical protein